MNRIAVKSLESEELQVFSAAREAELLHYNEPGEGIFIAESPKVIHRALDAGYEPISLLLDERELAGEARSVAERMQDRPVYTAEAAVLSGITGFKLTRGALCAMKRRKLPTPEMVCREARRVVVLEAVENPANVGSIFRNAAALGMDAVLLTKGCSDPFYRRALRTGMGTALQIPWAWIPAENDAVYMKKLGFTTVAMALRENSMSVRDPELRRAEKLAIFLGTEGEGLADTTIRDADHTVCIPMYHGVDSLNVASASAVILFCLSCREGTEIEE